MIDGCSIEINFLVLRFLIIAHGKRIIKKAFTIVAWAIVRISCKVRFFYKFCLEFVLEKQSTLDGA